MSAQRLDVYLGTERIGVLGNADGSVHFQYDADYWRRDDAVAVSCSLPLQGDALPQRATLAYFGGLLPEEAQRRGVAAVLGLSEGNVLGLLDALGGDCAGAVTLLAEGQSLESEPASEPVELSVDDLDTRLRRAPTDPFAASEHGDFRLSLAGAQAKLPVIWDDATGRAALPRSSSSPTTHILKPGSSSFPELVANEFFCMRLAAAIGLRVAPVDLELTPSGLSYLRVTRYDREGSGSGVRRLHQEDICQALGVPAEQKYENEGGPSLAATAGLLQQVSAVPAADRLALWEAAIFNVLIGNCDAHGKNFSILWHGHRPRLAPLYDLVSTAVFTPPRLDPPLTTRLAMRIGPAISLHEVDRAAISDLAERLGFRPAAMLHRADEVAARAVAQSRELAERSEHQSAISGEIVELIASRAARIAS